MASSIRCSNVQFSFDEDTCRALEGRGEDRTVERRWEKVGLEEVDVGGFCKEWKNVGALSMVAIVWTSIVCLCVAGTI